MRFSESHAPVNKERVIDASGIFGDRKGSGMRKIIVFTDDKGIKGIRWKTESDRQTIHAADSKQEFHFLRRRT